MSIQTLLRSAEGGGGVFKAFISDEWLQGRTCYGGLSAALALAAARQTEEGLPPLRSAQVSFIGPLSGEVVVNAKIVRRGRNAAWVQADVVGEAGLGLSATFVFMNAIESHVHFSDVPAPKAQPPEECKANLIAPDALRFLQHMEWRFALPKAETPLPEIVRWVRFKDRAGLDPITEILAIADALPPGILPLTTKRMPVSSMTWLCNFLTPTPQTRDGWWLLSSSSNFAQEGCSSEFISIWNVDGEPIASGMQSVALFS